VANLAVTQAVRRTLRFVDLCAGLGGFHRALGLSASGGDEDDTRRVDFECVLAAELEPELRRLYVQNFPEVGATYSKLFPPRRVAGLASSLDEEAREAVPLYGADGTLEAVHGDLSALIAAEGDGLRLWPDAEGPSDWVVPEHDLLCAGFPCQPFSKSGSQRGFGDLRGTVFHLIVQILTDRRPSLVLLENVGNFDRHDGGNTWKRVEAVLDALGYDVAATRHKASGGAGATGLLSPHHLGLPHHRERFFILAQHREKVDWLAELDDCRVLSARPVSESGKRTMAETARTRLTEIVEFPLAAQEEQDLVQAQVPSSRVTCVTHWNQLLGMMAEQDGGERGSGMWRDSMPSFPIWGFELDPWQWYPIDVNPSDWINRHKRLPRERSRLLDEAVSEVSDQTGRRVNLLDFPPRGERDFLAVRELDLSARRRWVETWPRYARNRTKWPVWKQRFLKQNRQFAVRLWANLDPRALREWLDALVADVPAPSNQKMEWNCKGEELDLWTHILQFRPSGLRVKRFGNVPALVAMTTTQIPIVPVSDPRGQGTSGDARARGRHLLRSEALQLQGFPRDWSHPSSRESAFRAFGNAVHCELVAQIMRGWLAPPTGSEGQLPLALNASKQTDLLDRKPGVYAAEMLGEHTRKAPS
jgi:DNA (cytosine-5)-methyltransferase 1